MTTSVEVLRGNEIKEGDTMPSLRVKLYEDGDPFNLSGYTVDISMKRSNSDTLIVDEKTMSIENNPRGIVSYSWDSSETSESGTYVFECTAWDGMDQITFPNNTYTKLHIEDSL